MFTSVRRFLFSVPHFPEDDDKSRRAGLLHVILTAQAGVLALVIVGTLISIFRDGGDRTAELIVMAVASSLIILWRTLMWRGLVSIASGGMIIFFLTSVTMILASGGTIRSAGAIYLPLTIVMASLLISRRAGLVFFIITSLISIGLVEGELRGLLPAPENQISFSSHAIVVSGMGLATVLLYLASRGTENALDLARKNEQELRSLANSLEQRVEERTRALATSAEVSRRLSTILNPDQLVLEVVEQVKTAFNYYHTHIYLLDEGKRILKLVGGTGEAGQLMLKRGHTIPIERGLVGRAARMNAPVLVPDTVNELGWLRNPLLPETKAEIAVPIAFGETILGVLDVQHNLVNGLTEADVELLQSIASQVAVAIQNARQYAQSRDREEDLSMMLEYSPEAIGFVNTQTGLFENVNAAAEHLYGLPRKVLYKVGPAQLSPEFQPDGRPSLDAALEKIGEALQGQKPVFEWTITNAAGELIPCEVRLVGMTEARSHLVRFSVTNIGERKRIEQELAKRANRDRVLNRIATKIRGAVSMEQVLQVAAQEVRIATKSARSVAVIEPNEDTMALQPVSGRDF